jgi:hypothetical protein
MITKTTTLKTVSLIVVALAITLVVAGTFTSVYAFENNNGHNRNHQKNNCSDDCNSNKNQNNQNNQGNDNGGNSFSG